MKLTMTGPLFCNLGAQGVCPLHQCDHNYGTFRGPPINPAPILAVHNTMRITTRVHDERGAATFYMTKPETARVFQPGDWT